jgi:flavin reductase (DIM6/NTAB) family NADH-FMN oxidoreductase RutF
MAGKKVRSPIVDECLIHYECRVIHKNDVVPSELAPDIPPMFYSEGNYHRLFFGQILSAYASVKLPASFVLEK